MKHKHKWQYQKSFEKWIPLNERRIGNINVSIFFVFVCECGRIKEVEEK